MSSLLSSMNTFYFELLCSFATFASPLAMTSAFYTFSGALVSLGCSVTSSRDRLILVVTELQIEGTACYPVFQEWLGGVLVFHERATFYDSGSRKPVAQRPLPREKLQMICVGCDLLGYRSHWRQLSEEKEPAEVSSVPTLM